MNKFYITPLSYTCQISYMTFNLLFFGFSQAVMRQARADLTSLTFSRPPSMPPRGAMVTQSLEHLPRPGLTGFMMMPMRHAPAVPPPPPAQPQLPNQPPPASNLSLHSFLTGQQPTAPNPFHGGPQVVPSIASNYHVGALTCCSFFVKSQICAGLREVLDFIIV